MLEAIEVCRPLQGEPKPGDHQQFNGGVKWPAISKKLSSSADGQPQEIIESTNETTEWKAEESKPPITMEIRDSFNSLDDPDAIKVISSDDKDFDAHHVMKSVKIVEDLKEFSEEETNVENLDKYVHSLLEWPTGRGWFIQVNVFFLSCTDKESFWVSISCDVLFEPRCNWLDKMINLQKFVLRNSNPY